MLAERCCCNTPDVSFRFFTWNRQSSYENMEHNSFSCQQTGTRTCQYTRQPLYENMEHISFSCAGVHVPIKVHARVNTPIHTFVKNKYMHVSINQYAHVSINPCMCVQINQYYLQYKNQLNPILWPVIITTIQIYIFNNIKHTTTQQAAYKCNNYLTPAWDTSLIAAAGAFPATRDLEMRPSMCCRTRKWKCLTWLSDLPSSCDQLRCWLY